MKKDRASQSRPEAGSAASRPAPGAGFVRRRAWLAGLALLAATVIAYLPALHGDYVWDDDHYLTANPVLRTAEGLQRIWLDPSATIQYYPMFQTSFWLQYQLAAPAPGKNPDPFPFHLVNVLLHALNAILLWRILRLLSVPWPWFAAAILALHPVHTESVAWITERKNVLSGAFGLAAVWAYLRFHAHPGSTRRYLLAFALFVLALLSKTAVAVIPAVLLVLIWWKRGSLTRRDILLALPMLALGIAAGLFSAHLEQGQVRAQGPLFAQSLLDRFLIAGRALWFYVGKLVLPIKLSFAYPRWEIDPSVWWQYLYPLGAAAVIAALWILRRRIGRAPLAAVLIFAGTLFPALGFATVYFARYSFVADHFQYLASIGLIALFAGAVGGWAESRSGRPLEVLRVAGGVLLLVLLGLTWKQSHIYKDVRALWSDTLEKNPRSTLALNNLGVWHVRRGDRDSAYPLFVRSLEVDPDQPRALENLANLLADLGRPDEAIGHYQRALELTRATGEDLRTFYWNLGLVYRKKGSLPEALAQFEQGLALYPDDPRLHYVHGETLLLAGRRAEAVAAFREALRWSDEDPQFRQAAAQALKQLVPGG